MTAEFGRVLRDLQGNRSLLSIARSAGKEQTLLHKASRGWRNFSPEMAMLYAPVLKVPKYDLPRFYLLAIGAPQPFVDESLAAINHAGLPIEPSTFPQLLLNFLEHDGRSREVIGGFAGVDQSHITHLVHGERRTRTETDIALARELKIPLERRAEFVLLGRGFPPEVVYESLHAYYTHAASDRPHGELLPDATNGVVRVSG